MTKFWELFVFFLKKIGFSFLNIIAFFIGMFLWGLTLGRINIPYLLEVPQYVESIIAFVFALTFVSIVVVSVRTNWCYENDLFLAQKGDRWWTLLRQIVTSREFLADVAVFMLCDMVFSIVVGVDSQAPWYRVILGVAILVTCGSALFGAFDCLLYVIARKKADKRLYRREE